MKTYTVPSSLISIQTNQPISPSMRAAIWVIGAALDEQRIKPGHRDPVWLSIPTSRLRGEGGRDDNQHLRVTLDRLCGVYLTGEHKGDEWGAVILAEWHLEQGGSMAKLFIPPTAVASILAPKTFAKIEARAAHSLSGHARQLYVLLADKKNMGQQHWTYTVDELRSLLGCDNKKAYQVWAQFAKWVLLPAVEAINDFGTVSVKLTTKRLGRSVHWVRFDWKWKNPQEAVETDVENEKHSAARRKGQASADAPPLVTTDSAAPRLNTDQPQGNPARDWWHGLTDAEREGWADKVGRTMTAGDSIFPRPERVIMEDAYARARADNS